MYLQDDRDLRGRAHEEEAREGVRLHDPPAHPGRRLHAGAMARSSTGSPATTPTARCALTTRQTFQFHGVIKSNLKATMQAIDAALLDTLAACGDVNRNVMATPTRTSRARIARRSSWRAHLGPPAAAHRAYREIWLDGEKIAGGEERWSSRSTAGPTCRGSSRPWSRCRPRTTSTSSRRTSASSPSSTTPARSPAGT